MQKNASAGGFFLTPVNDFSDEISSPESLGNMVQSG